MKYEGDIESTVLGTLWSNTVTTGSIASIWSIVTDEVYIGFSVLLKHFPTFPLHT